MAQQRGALSDQRIEEIIGNLLRTAVLLAAAVVLLGGVLYMVRHGLEVRDYDLFKGEPQALRTFSGIFRDTLTFHSRGLIQLGLLMLIATPILRVLFSVFAFAYQQDRLYVVVTLIVLTLLIYSLAGGSI